MDLASAQPKRVVKNGRIQQSVALWCYAAAPWNWSLERLCRVAAALGLKSVELASPEDWPAIRKHGLICALAPNGMPDPPFVKGLNNPRYQDQVAAATRQAIDQCAAFGVPNVIAFTGFKWRDAENPKNGEISREEGAAHTVKALKELARHAEAKNVTLCLEMLNTRDNSDPMKGHPGYQGDDLDYCAEIVRRAGSPRVKLLFDVYHVQIMQGDVIRRLRQYAELIGHVHVAGCPGRGELDARQEINFPAVMRALLDAGYRGYVGQEFVPARDPLRGLMDAVALCDV
ncbi:MAG: TIM barrel protein [Acidobacteria bacterium]|nr:TIM barrel protein [Acidobacteriota bacterium]